MRKKLTVTFPNPRKSKLPGKSPWLVLLGLDGKRLGVAGAHDFASVPWGLRLTGDIAFTNLAPLKLPVATRDWGLVAGFGLAHRRNGKLCWVVRLAVPVVVHMGDTLCFPPGALFAEGRFQCQTAS